MTPGGAPRAQAIVGVVVVALVLLAAVFVVVIWPRLQFSTGPRVQIAFHHVGPLREGAPVIVAGHTIGKVDSIALVPPGGVPEGHPLATTGGAVVWVELHAGRRRMFAANAEVFVSSRGFLSERYLEIGPPPDGAPPGPPVEPGAILVGVDPPQLDRALQRTWDNLQKSRQFLEEVRPEAEAFGASLDRLALTLATIEPMPGAVAVLIGKVRDVLSEVRTLRATLEGAGADPDSLYALADRAEATLGRVRAALDRVRASADLLLADLDRVRDHVGAVAPDTIARVRATLADADRQLARLQALAANTRSLLAMIRRGEGSAFKLSNDPEFPEDAKELGRILKRTPWRVIGRTGQETTHPDP